MALLFAQVKVTQECFAYCSFKRLHHTFNFCTVSSILLSYISPFAFCTLFRGASKDREDRNGMKRADYHKLQRKQNKILSKFVICLDLLVICSVVCSITISSSFPEGVKENEASIYFNISKSRVSPSHRQVIFEAPIYWTC